VDSNNTNFLENLTVLVADCQAIGSHPPTAHLFEVGWSTASAGRPAGAVACDSVSFLLQLPDGVSISRAVERLTGIDSSDLSAGARTPEVYRQLEAAARSLLPVGRNGLCPTVIHFARYEKAFLRHLHRSHSPSRAFPFDIICTHDITRRLMPGLPRKGLRAVAGFLGHPVPALKRCAAHTAATAFIWQNLVRLLAQDAGIQTWDELHDWLRTCPVPSAKRSFPMPREARAALPAGPGIYRMLRSNGDILYIGKAASLKQRVNSYFQTCRRHAEHTLEMLSQAVGLEVTPTASALEAALLESGEIKRVCPPYNKALQEGRRQLVFGAKDFRSFSPVPDGTHCVGPLPGSKAFAAVHEIGSLVQQGIPTAERLQETVNENLLGIPSPQAPDPHCFVEGLRLFRHRHTGLPTAETIWTALMRIGTRCWKDALETEENKIDEDGDTRLDPDGQTDPQPFEWTPEAVTGAIESLLCRCAHLIRRARWFAMLTETTLAWSVADGTGSRQNVVILRAAQASARCELRGDESLPVPPGAAIAWRDRQRHLDLAAYDRLRVLTTEMRRISAEKRTLRLRLGRNVVLGEGRLRRLLRWV
jgi:DNA polymerase III epsilon subunit-like protein